MLLKPALAAGLLAMAFAASSCGKSSKSSGDSWVIDNLDGTWVIGCTATTYYPGATHVAKTLTLSNGGYSYTQETYSNSSCTAQVMSISETGTIKVVGGKASAHVRDLDFVQSSFTAMAHTSAVTTILNTTGTTSNALGTTIPELCFRMVPTDVDSDPSSPLVPDPVGDPFIQGVPKDISGLNCSAGYENPVNGSTVVGVYYYLEDSNQLMLGSPSTAQLGVVVVGKISNVVRPSTVDETLRFSRR